MGIEPTEFNIFGVHVKQEDLVNIRSATAETYNSLTKGAERWADSEFCKRQITSLWEGIEDMLWRLSKGEPTIITSDAIRTLLITDKDNQEFLNALGAELRGEGTLDSILKQLEEVRIEPGSLWIQFNDSVARRRAEARIEVDKMLSRIKRERSKIVNELSHFIDWVKENKRPLLTSSLAAGIIVTSIVAVCYAGVPILVSHLLIMTFLAVICLIYDAYSASKDIGEVRKILARRLGLHI